MKINLLAIGTKMPSWVTAGMQDYLKRMPADYAVNLIEVPAIKRDRHVDITSVLSREAQKLKSHCQPGSLTVALDRLGKSISTTQLADALLDWHDMSQDINLLIGGPEGIDSNLIKSADHRWSLSALTLPHPMVRVLIAEQLYRAVTIIQGHPYHR